MIKIRCPVCGKVGYPHAICNHFVKMHPEAYAVVQKYAMRYKYGWICRLCGKDFAFITSVYVHIMKAHFNEPVDNHINILTPDVEVISDEQVKIEAR